MIPFIYRAIEVRTAQDTNGDPLFCLSDICKCLGLTNPSMVASQIKEEFQPADSKVSDPMLNMGEYSLPMREFQTTKGRQTFLMITEPQLYFVMMRSRTEYARAFRQWIYKEVLPCLRKTGGNPDAKGGNLRELMENAAYLLKLAGIEGNQLVLSLDKLHKHETGKSLLALTGTQLLAPVQEQLHTPTELGKVIGLSAVKVNLMLAGKGYQVKGGAGWELTGAGKAAGGVYLDTNKRHSDGTPVRQIKWPSEILNED